MRVVLQRVTHARVLVDDAVVGQIGPGILVLLGITQADGIDEAKWLADKIVSLRLFGDDEGKMNRDVTEVSGSILVVSQFTLYGDCRKGRRPSFIEAARPEHALPLYEAFINAIRAFGVPVATGQFGASMQVELTNDGPVTLVVEKAGIKEEHE